jgi:hypothetical protein
MRCRGYRNLYTPYVAGVLKSRTHRPADLRDRKAEAVMVARYEAWIAKDPCYHPLYTRHTEDFRLNWDIMEDASACNNGFWLEKKR